MLRSWKKDLVHHITYKPNKYGQNIVFEKNGKRHNEGFPALIKFYTCLSSTGKKRIYELKYKHEGKYHRIDGPAVIVYGHNNKVSYVAYYTYDMLHRVTDEGIFKPAVIVYYTNGIISSEEYYVLNIRHRPDGPAYIMYNELGDVLEEKYYLNGKIHRPVEQGPSIINYHYYFSRNGKYKKRILNETYYLNGKIHNDVGPAIFTYHRNGNIAMMEYYLDGLKHGISSHSSIIQNGKKGEEEVPAVTKYNELGKKKREIYYVRGIKYRANGPIIIDYYPNGNVKREVYCTNCNEIGRYSSGIYSSSSGYSSPRIIEYYPNGNLKKEIYYANRMVHRYLGPAKIWYDKNGNVVRQLHYHFGKKIE